MGEFKDWEFYRGLQKVNIGVICSAGGSPFFYAADILIAQSGFKKENFFLLTDRACLAEKTAELKGFQKSRVTLSDPQSFSQRSLEYFVMKKCDLVILLFSRLVTAELFENMITLNIHPSVLPQFPGLSAVKKAFEAKVKLFGATLHFVNEGIDTGEIVAQVSTDIGSSMTFEQMNRISFVQKTYLFLVGVEQFQSRKLNIQSSLKSHRSSDFSLIRLDQPAHKVAFQEFQNSLGLGGLLV